jgi:hydrogenase maturation protease
MAKTLIVGLGNPILGDDGVGWKVAESVSVGLQDESRYQLPYRPIASKTVQHLSTVDVDCLSLGGLSLMEHLIGYERVIIIDSMETGEYPVGSVRVFPLASLPDPMAGHSTSTHDATLMTALATAEQLGAEIPKQVDIVAIEAEHVYDFGEELSPVIAAAVPCATTKVMELLQNK